MRRIGWITVLGACGLAIASGCSSPAANSSATPNQANGFHWPGAPSPPQQAFATPPSTTSDPTSLAAKPEKLGPDLYVATAKIYETTGNKEAAADQYRKAIKLDAGFLPALIGYAHLKDTEEQYTEADKLYQAAVKKDPKQPAIYNDWAMSLEHRKKHREAVDMLSRAIDLQPDKALYRNNIAAILVELGRNDEALKHLTAVHGPAVAQYNLATMLYRKGNEPAARAHFTLAAKADPSLTAAVEWSQRLDPAGNRPAPQVAVQPMPQPPMASPAQYAAQPPVAQAPIAQPPMSPPQQRVSLANRRPIVVEDRPETVAVTLGDGGPNGVRFAGEPSAQPQAPSPVRYPQYLPAPAAADGPLPPSPDDGPALMTAERPLLYPQR